MLTSADVFGCWRSQQNGCFNSVQSQHTVALRRASCVCVVVDVDLITHWPAICAAREIYQRLVAMVTAKPSSELCGWEMCVNARSILYYFIKIVHYRIYYCRGNEKLKQEVKVIWQKAPHGGPIPRLGVTPGGRNLYHWIPGVGFPISVP